MSGHEITQALLGLVVALELLHIRHHQLLAAELSRLAEWVRLHDFRATH